jgi:hypothetical protein
LIRICGGLTCESAPTIPSHCANVAPFVNVVSMFAVSGSGGVLESVGSGTHVPVPENGASSKSHT